MAGVIKPEKYQRQRTRKRIYVDSSHGPFKCPGCDIVTFSNRRALDLHMKRVHKAGIMECDECGRKVLDLKRHKEILHKRFKIYNCPHCSDKYCSQEDLERHLMKVEMNNFVMGRNLEDGSETVEELSIDVKPRESLVENIVETNGDSDEKSSETRNEEDAHAEDIMKQMETKTYSCSECGLKTPSRMTYIQHVLNGCIMDMVLGETGSTEEEGASPARGQSGRGRKRGAMSGPLGGGLKKRGRPVGSKNRVVPSVPNDLPPSPSTAASE